MEDLNIQNFDLGVNFAEPSTLFGVLSDKCVPTEKSLY